MNVALWPTILKLVKIFMNEQPLIFCNLIFLFPLKQNLLIFTGQIEGILIFFSLFFKRIQVLVDGLLSKIPNSNFGIALNYSSASAIFISPSTERVTASRNCKTTCKKKTRGVSSLHRCITFWIMATGGNLLVAQLSLRLWVQIGNYAQF